MLGHKIQFKMASLSISSRCLPSNWIWFGDPSILNQNFCIRSLCPKKGSPLVVGRSIDDCASNFQITFIKFGLCGRFAKLPSFVCVWPETIVLLTVKAKKLFASGNSPTNAFQHFVVVPFRTVCFSLLQASFRPPGLEVVDVWRSFQFTMQNKNLLYRVLVEHSLFYMANYKFKESNSEHTTVMQIRLQVELRPKPFRLGRCQANSAIWRSA